MAVSDAGGIIATPLETLVVTSVDDGIRQICEAVAGRGAIGIVLGLPLSMSGDESEMTGEVRAFADKLRAACAVPVHFEDERLSSRQAEQILHAHGKKIKGNKPKLDRLSAAIILQSFLDRRNLKAQLDNDLP